MITEDYVSFETAKLLKEKGFNVDCNVSYFNGSLVDYTMYGFCDGKLISCPTLQMAMKWLREVHNLSIDNTCSIRGFYCSIVHIVKDKGGRIIDVEDSADWETPYCKTYEESVNKAIVYALENLVS